LWAPGVFGLPALLSRAVTEGAVTFTAVVGATAERMAIDRDDDGFFNSDEVIACADPADPFSTPANSACCVGDLTSTGATLAGQPGFGVPDGVADPDDLGYYLGFWLVSDAAVADMTTSGATLAGQPGFGVPDGVVDLDDLGFFLNAWSQGCP